MTYKNLSTWYTELRQYRPAIPTLLAANKIDENMEVRRQFISLQQDQLVDELYHQVTTKSFAFAGKNDLPLFYVSAADGTNVVKLFRWHSWCLQLGFCLKRKKLQKKCFHFLFCTLQIWRCISLPNILDLEHRNHEKLNHSFGN